MEKYFNKYRKSTIGYNKNYTTPYGIKEMVYADWTASGRLYNDIERKVIETFGPFVGNTHSESSTTGRIMTKSYIYARQCIKKHVNADENDVIITYGSGTTGVINKFQRILGLRIPEKFKDYNLIPERLKPVVFVTHMEHHSNQTSWLETCAEVVVLEPDENGLVDLNNLEEQLKKYSSRQFKIGSFTACSNITGIQTPYHEMAKLMHKYNGLCFVDFASSAPYVKIDMHPKDTMEQLDAIFFSTHKFLGGPGAPGVLIFNSKLYSNQVPDVSGGGTVNWTNPWGGVEYLSDIETREDGGTPAFLQTIKAALCISLKDEMSVEKLLCREHQIVEKVLNKLCNMENVHVLAENIKDRLSIFSFCIKNAHYNLIVKILDERYGIQVRGGCSCAGTYGHYLLGIDKETSRKIKNEIDLGDSTNRPGWVRLSIHPIMTDKEIDYMLDAIEEVSSNIDEFKKDYVYNCRTNEFTNINPNFKEADTKDLFQF